MIKYYFNYFINPGFPEKYQWVFTLYEKENPIVLGYIDSYEDYSYLAIQKVENLKNTFPLLSKHFKGSCGIYGYFKESIHYDINSDKDTELLEKVLFIMTFKILKEVEKELSENKKLSFTYDFRKDNSK